MINESQDVIARALLLEVLNQPGTFQDVFQRAWPKFKKSHVGGEELARLKSYEILYDLSMRGAITKENRVYRALVDIRALKKLKSKSVEADETDHD